MKFLPFEKISYRTKLTEDEVINRLMKIIVPEKLIQLKVLIGKSKKTYQGQITGQSFYMSRISYGNSFRPMITGKIKKGIDETIINVRMRLGCLVTLFLIVWCGGVTFIFITLLTASFKNNVFHPEDLFPLIGLAFAYAITMIGFKLESINSKKYLKKLFESQIILKKNKQL